MANARELMDQMRAGQALYASRCGEGDRCVVDVIERGLVDRARRDVEAAGGGAVASLEAELLRKQALVPGAAEEMARIRALLALDARHMEALGAYEDACLSMDLTELESLDKDIRVLKMRVGRERKRADASARRAQRALDGARDDARSVASQIFAAGYFEDVWQGREALLPRGLTPIR